MGWGCTTQTRGTNLGGYAKSINIMGFKELHGVSLLQSMQKQFERLITWLSCSSI